MSAGWNEKLALRPGLTALGCSDGKTLNWVAIDGIIDSNLLIRLQPGLRVFAAALLKRAVDGGLYRIAKIHADSCHFIYAF